MMKNPKADRKKRTLGTVPSVRSIKEGGYKCGWKTSDRIHFYRFTDPKPGYPFMIELFSREPDYIKQVPEGIVPLHIDDDTSSLSAILLNDDYYQFMLAGRETVNEISVLRSVKPLETENCCDMLLSIKQVNRPDHPECGEGNHAVSGSGCRVEKVELSF